MSDDLHVKTFADPAEARAEAAGLLWMAGAETLGGVETVRLHPDAETAPDRLAMDRVHEGRPTRRAAERFGRALAHTHAAGARWWGCPPDGWADADPLRMGRSRTPFVAHADAPGTWGAFYAEYRILDFVRRIADSGGLDAQQVRVFERVAERVRTGTFEERQPALVGSGPARLHGDLWSGNVLWPVDQDAPTGAVLIDPIAHGGHAETDLALLALFGLPYLDTVVDAYDAESPLAAGWQERVGLHQLAPLLLHTLLFGGSYTDAAVRTASRYV
ncbi:fructosamine kinase family protein [Curtobacterium sp. RRHDQ10]|uniref:fructosamine kinase family protein n=1 Tax=Curtobacterium phyllosphaerae TaxID=3413379 RepID=UPI003BF0EA11